MLLTDAKNYCFIIIISSSIVVDPVVAQSSSLHQCTGPDVMWCLRGGLHRDSPGSCVSVCVCVFNFFVRYINVSSILNKFVQLFVVVPII